jgi:hypothetical protein
MKLGFEEIDVPFLVLDHFLERRARAIVGLSHADAYGVVVLATFRVVGNPEVIVATAAALCSLSFLRFLSRRATSREHEEMRRHVRRHYS